MFFAAYLIHFQDELKFKPKEMLLTWWNLDHHFANILRFFDWKVDVLGFSREMEPIGHI